MSQENVDLVRRGFDAFNRRDLDAFLADCHADVEFISYAMQLEGGDPYRGHDGVRAWWEGLIGVYPDFRVEIEVVRDLGDLTITKARMHGRGVESEAPMDQEAWQVGRFQDGKVIGWHFFSREAEALEAAGLWERPLPKEKA